MNKKEVIMQVSEKSGVDAADCEQIIKAFEVQSQASLVNRFKGIKGGHSDMLTGVSEKSGISTEECEKVLKVLDEVMDTGLSKKIRFWDR